MRFGKDKEEGFLLLESLITLSMIASIILLLFPLLTRWLLIREEAKDEVEFSRLIYEQSMRREIQQATSNKTSAHVIRREKDGLKISNNRQSTEVVIYDYEFE